MSDRLPPHSAKDEAAVLGACLLDTTLAGELKREWFFLLEHQQAADAIVALAADGAPIESGILTQRLMDSGVPDVQSSATVARMVEACPSAANFSYHSARLRDCLTLRRLVMTAQTAISNAYLPNADASAVLDEFERRALAIRAGSGTDGTDEVDLRAVLLELTGDYERAMRGETPAGIRTGYPDLDRMLGSLKPGQLMIVAARPSVGKTSLALNIAEHVAVDTGQRVGFFSLEMTAAELIHRLVCGRARIESDHALAGRLTDRQLARMAEVQPQIAKAPLHLCDRGGLSIAQLTGLARRMVQRHAIKLLIVDYLGLLRSGDKGRSRYEETTAISNALKTLAKDLAVPAIVLAQLNRDTDRENRPPRLSDLRDSGAIEQDADIVALLHRPENATGDAHKVALIIAKHRNGPIGKVDLLFHRRFTRFDSTVIDAMS